MDQDYRKASTSTEQTAQSPEPSSVDYGANSENAEAVSTQEEPTPEYWTGPGEGECRDPWWAGDPETEHPPVRQDLDEAKIRLTNARVEVARLHGVAAAQLQMRLGEQASKVEGVLRANQFGDAAEAAAAGLLGVAGSAGGPELEWLLPSPRSSTSTRKTALTVFLPLVKV